MSENMKISKIAQTCWACPSQWEGNTFNGDDVYIRYRWGRLSISLNGERVYSKQISSNNYDGTMNFEKLRLLTNHFIDWSEVHIVEEMEI